MNSPQFTHLNLHSEYSISDGIVRIKPLIKQAKALGFDCLALTDINNIFGLIKFYNAAKNSGIKPIIGADVYIRSEDIIHRLTLLCQNNQGYKNLCEIISDAYLLGQKNHHIAVDEQQLIGKTQGLIALSGDKQGLIGQHLQKNAWDHALQTAKKYSNLFNHQFFIEIRRIGTPNEENFIDSSLKFAQQTHIPAVATNQVCFMEKSDFEAHEARICINQGTLLEDENRVKNYTEEQYFKSPQEMEALFSDYPQIIENAYIIAQKCNVNLDLGNSYLPFFENELGLSEADYMQKLAQEGLEKRLIALYDNKEKIAEVKPDYDKRLKFEIDIINQMQFPGYFLIVADFIQWAKQNDIPVGPGRGSGAGSLVAYVLGITDLDPLEYDLLFERFLNPERVSMPDFDIDFCVEKRDLVIEYVAQKYGKDKVSQIITHGTMAAKAVIRDVGRVLGMGYNFVDSIAKLIPFKPGTTLDEAMQTEPELVQRYDNEEDVKLIWDLAKSLEGITRNVGKHAGGVIIAPSKLTDFSALYCESDGSGLVVQYDKKDIELAGLVKFDFLGLKNLTIIESALKAINLKNQEIGKPKVDILSIPLDDLPTYNIYQNAETNAVFQVESFGMKDLLKRLKPDCFDDIIALMALYRPGPLGSGMVDDFVNVKHGRQKANYPLPELEEILAPTYGVMLYQEQVMQVAQVLASYSLGQADILRRAMGKKDPKEMAKQRDIFVEGAVNNGHEKKQSEYIFDLMEKFSEYGFNKSHSAAYALVSYQTAWLKAHYSEVFMAAVLSADIDNTDKIVMLIEECRTMDIVVKPPSINESELLFTVNEHNEIVYGLGAIKGAGEAALNAILDYRKRYGKIANIEDFFLQIDFSKLNKRVLEALITAGVFDELEPNRAFLFEHLQDFLKVSDQHQQNQQSGQSDLFGAASNESADNPSNSFFTNLQSTHYPFWDEKTKLNHEKTSLGLYLTGHPITAYKETLRQIISNNTLAETLGKLKELDAQTEVGDKKAYRQQSEVTIAGLITSVRIKKTRNSKMAIVEIDDQTARTEVTFFGKNYETNKDILCTDELLIIKGHTAFDDFSKSWRIKGGDCFSFYDYLGYHTKAIQISLLDSQINDDLMQCVQSHLSENNQGAEIYLNIQTPTAKGKLKLPDHKKVIINESFCKQIEALAGKNCVDFHLSSDN